MVDQMNSTIGSYEPDKLFVGAGIGIIPKGVILKAGQVYKRGTVLGIITTSEKATIVNSANTDGSQFPKGILADDVDATAGDTRAVAYVSGEFNQAALIFGGTDTYKTHEDALDQRGMFLRRTY